MMSYKYHGLWFSTTFCLHQGPYFRDIHPQNSVFACAARQRAPINYHGSKSFAVSAANTMKYWVFVSFVHQANPQADKQFSSRPATPGKITYHVNTHKASNVSQRRHDNQSHNALRALLNNTC